MAQRTVVLGASRWRKRREFTVAANPFENPDAEYRVLVNDEGQHSLWPVFADVPDGWKVLFGKDGRQECLDFIEKNWTDLRPNSLIRQMEAAAAASPDGVRATQSGAVIQLTLQRVHCPAGGTVHRESITSMC